MLSTAIQRHPSIRLLLPLAVGIAIRWYIPITHLEWVWVLLLFAWLVAVSEVIFNKRHDWIFAAALNITIICCGYLLTSWQLSKTDYTFSDQPGHYIAIVKKPPQEKPRTYLLEANVYELGKKSHDFLLYVAKDDSSATIVQGDTILLYAKLQPPNNDFTGDFDYVSYLKRKGITGTGYIKAGHWIVKGHNDVKDWIQQCQDLRTAIIDKFKSLGFSGDAFAIITALTTGIKDDLSDEIRETYSIAGVSHVLALSGLHIGLVYGFMLLLFMPLWKRASYIKLPSICLIIGTLWIYAIFTGLSTSVVRSTIMFSIHAIASFKEEHPAGLHILTFTAFGMLLYNPLWLFDVGFQLSFIAVASILILQPRIALIVPDPKLNVIKKIKDIMTVSIAAQIGTAPLVILYFHRFSTHFLLSNLLVLPLITIIMYGAVMMLFTTPLPGIQQWVAEGVNSLIEVLNGLLYQLAGMPLASIDNLRTNALEIALFYCCVYLFIRYLNLRTACRAISTLLATWLMVGCHLISTIMRL
ncbi:MAG: competence protein ComEC family protein [Bacteroidaceae bacterium]|nr:competence protein ComEC family protein [Bacteroidaceae bacterium]